MTIETKEQMIGALTLVALVVFLFALNQRDDVALTPAGTIRVEALFGKVDGLVSGDEVRMGGVPVGKVTGQRLDAGFRAVVTMTLDKVVPVPKDSSASVQTDGLFGTKFVTIEPGAETDVLKTGDRIVRTQDSQVVSDILDMIISEGRARLAERDKAAPEQGAGK